VCCRADCRHTAMSLAQHWIVAIRRSMDRQEDFPSSRRAVIRQDHLDRRRREFGRRPVAGLIAVRPDCANRRWGLRPNSVPRPMPSPDWLTSPDRETSAAPEQEARRWLKGNARDPDGPDWLMELPAVLSSGWLGPQ